MYPFLAVLAAIISSFLGIKVGDLIWRWKHPEK